jgi:hypothetical protein
MTCVRETHTRSPEKSITRASLELQVPQKAVWNILRKRLRMFPYRLQLLQNLAENVTRSVWTCSNGMKEAMSSLTGQFPHQRYGEHTQRSDMGN